VLRVPDELPLKILESFRRVIEKKDRLDALREELFSFNDGRSAERARDEVVECLRSDIGEKPILYHAFEAYKRTIGIASYEYIKRVKEKLNVYENALVNTHEQPPAFLSVILVDRHPEYLADTLKSLIWQKYPSERYEVIVITRRSEKEFTEILQTVFGEANKTSFVYVAQKEDQYPSLSLSESIKRARGNEIVFTHSGCIPESDWLLQYSLWFRRMPNSLGIGGYEKRLEKTPKNIFFQYKDYEIAKNLGLRLWKRGPKNFYLVENDLFYQNPCGILSNTAYRKEALQEVDIASLASNSWVVLELVLKTRILTRGRLTFVPFPVGVEYRETSEEFRRMNIDTGIAYSYLSRFERNKGSILRITVTSILWEALVSVAGRYGGSRISLARTILIAGWYQWLGFRTSNLHYFVGKVTFRK
jgi:glycosyltransferase involved in cell wall biosynthesis